jgi:integrase/recombinase XerC
MTSAAAVACSVVFDPRPDAESWDMAEKVGHVRTRIHRGKPRHYLDFGRLGKVYSLHGTPFTRAKAELILRSIQGRIAEGTDPQRAIEVYLPTHARAHRVEVWLARWIAEIESLEKSGDRSEGTLREYRRWAKVGGKHAHLQKLGARSIHSLSWNVLREWQRSIPLQGKSLKNLTAALSSFLGWLVRVGALDRKPVIPWPAHDEHVPSIIRPERQDAILAHWPEDELGVLLCMMLLGTRHSEAWVLTGGDYRDGYLWVRKARKGRRLDSPVRGTKNRQPRVLPVPLALAEWIEKHVAKETLLADGLLFTNRRTGGAWTPTSFRRRWSKACIASGQSVLNSYESLRHSTATEWLRRGASLREVQDLLGHRTPHMTPKYARLANERLVEIVGRRGSHVDPSGNRGEK